MEPPQFQVEAMWLQYNTWLFNLIWWSVLKIYDFYWKHFCAECKIAQHYTDKCTYIDYKGSSNNATVYFIPATVRDHEGKAIYEFVTLFFSCVHHNCKRHACVRARLCVWDANTRQNNKKTSDRIFKYILILKADSHIACRAHAAPMPFPCHAMPLRI